MDECAPNNGGCAQGCENTAGSFRCLCNPGFTLNSDGRTCSVARKLNCGVLGRGLWCKGGCGAEGCNVVVVVIVKTGWLTMGTSYPFSFGMYLF